MTPFFSPGPVEADGYPPIYIAAVSEPMLRMAGAHADGIHVHPLHTQRSLDQLTHKHSRAAASKAGRDPEQLRFVVPFMVATGKTRDAAIAAREPMRAQAAFYASTPAYRGVLEVEGKADIADQLWALSRQGAWGDMPALIDDELLDQICMCATWDELPEALIARYNGRADRLMPYAIPDDDTPWSHIANAVRKASAALVATS
jgi:probable F420-dependent oxidoreductase